jgi:hypothetical protein
VVNHIVIGHDESGAVHVYMFATAHEASEFIRLSQGLADIGWDQYWVCQSGVGEALNSVKRLEAV